MELRKLLVQFCSMACAVTSSTMITGLRKAKKSTKKQSEDRWLWSCDAAEVVEDNEMEKFDDKMDQLMGEWLSEWFGKLVEQLGHTDESVRSCAGGVLTRMGSCTPQATTALLKALKDDDSRKRARAIEVLEEVVRWSPELMEMTVPALLAALNDSQPIIRQAAAAALGTVGQGSLGVPEALITTLRKDEAAALAAIEALCKLRVESGAVSELISAMSHVNEDTRAAAESALVRIGPKAIPNLIRATRLDNPLIRANSANALGRIGEPGLGVLEALIDAMQKDKATARTAIHALGTIGASALTAVPALVEVLNHADEAIQGEAQFALMRMGPTVVPALVQALRHNDPMIRTNAAGTLSLLRRRSKPAVPDLIEALSDCEVTVRQHSAWALGRIGRCGREVIPALVNVLRNDDVVALDAIEALRELAKAKSVVVAVPALIEALDHANEEVRVIAAEILETIGQKAASELLKALNNNNPIICQRVGVVLARIDPKAVREVPAMDYPCMRRQSLYGNASKV
jgi:HEAT repeat protein